MTQTSRLTADELCTLAENMEEYEAQEIQEGMLGSNTFNVRYNGVKNNIEIEASGKLYGSGEIDNGSIRARYKGVSIGYVTGFKVNDSVARIRKITIETESRRFSEGADIARKIISEESR
jgi:hypothetical protein